MERAEHLKRRKELYEIKYPEVKHGGSPGNAGGGKIAIPKDEKISSFAESTATKLGVSPRTVQQEVQIAEKIDNEVKKQV